MNLFERLFGRPVSKQSVPDPNFRKFLNSLPAEDPDPTDPFPVVRKDRDWDERVYGPRPKTHHFHVSNHIGLTLAVVKVAQDGKTYHCVGYALCHPGDNGARKFGTRLAIARAQKMVNELDNNRTCFVKFSGAPAFFTAKTLFDANTTQLKEQIIALRHAENVGTNNEIKREFRNAYHGRPVRYL